MTVPVVFWFAVVIMWGIPITLGLSFWQVAAGYGVIIASGTVAWLYEADSDDPDWLEVEYAACLLEVGMPVYLLDDWVSMPDDEVRAHRWYTSNVVPNNCRCKSFAQWWKDYCQWLRETQHG